MPITASTTRIRAPAHLFLLLAAAVLLLRAAAPIGYMVSVGADGPVVTLCGDGLAQVVAFDPRTGEVSLGAGSTPDHNQEAAKKVPCAFAAASALALPNFAGGVATSFAPRTERALVLRSVRSLRALNLQSASPRGPPKRP